MRRKFLIKFFLATLLLIFLSLFSFVGYAEKTRVVYWSHTYDPAVELTNTMIKEFVKKNPEIEIVYDHVPHADFEPKLLTAFAAGTGPDAYWMGDWVMPKWIPAGVVEPVDYTIWGVKSFDEFAKLFEPGALKAFTWRDKIYTGGISEYNTFSVFYNPQHFREAGLPLPSKTSPITWRKLAEIAQKLTKFDEKGARIRSGFEGVYTVPIWAVLLLEPQIRQLGGEIVDEKGRPQLNSKECIETMRWWYELKTKYKATDPGFQSPDLWADFTDGRISMTIAGPWAISVIRNYKPDMEIGVMPLPVFEGGKRVTTLYAWAWFVNPRSKVKKATWEFIHYLSTQPMRWWKKVRYIQPVAGIWPKLMESEPLLETFVEDFKYAKYEFRSKDYYEISGILMRAFQRVVMENVTPEEALEKAQKEAEKI